MFRQQLSPQEQSIFLILFTIFRSLVVRFATIANATRQTRCFHHNRRRTFFGIIIAALVMVFSGSVYSYDCHSSCEDSCTCVLMVHDIFSGSDNCQVKSCGHDYACDLWYDANCLVRPPTLDQVVSTLSNIVKPIVGDSSSWNCATRCPEGLPLVIDKMRCETWKAFNGCGINIPSWEDVARDLGNLACWDKEIFITYTTGVANGCWIPGLRVSGTWFHTEVFDDLYLSAAAEKLVELGFYSREDFNGVEVTECGLSGLAAGMVPLPGKILINFDRTDYRDYTQTEKTKEFVNKFAPLLAHEMFHIKQMRGAMYPYEGWTFNKFACEYANGMLFDSGNYTVSTKFNRVELPAYDMGDQVKKVIKNNQNNNNIPIKVTDPDFTTKLAGLESIYELVRQPMTWINAKTYCEAIGGHLATPSSEQANKKVMSIAGGDLIWLGGTDEGHEGRWTWVTGEPWDYQGWEMSVVEPNGGTNGNHLMMGDYNKYLRVIGDIGRWFGPDWINLGQWNDADGNTQLNFVCEWEPSKITYPLYDLTVENYGGYGSITSAPSRINCGDVCSTKFPNGATVILTAHPEILQIWGGKFIEYYFHGWSGACSGPNTGTCTLIMDAPKRVYAMFRDQLPYILTINKSGTGTGVVSSDGRALYTGGVFASGDMINLTAVATTGSTFIGWSPSPCATSFTMQANDLTCTATFTAILPNTYKVTVTKTGSGSGTVGGGGSYAADTIVNLTAKPDTGSTFAGWNPSPCAASFAMLASNLTCTATFNRSGQSVGAAVGVFRNGSWFLDANGNGFWDGGDSYYPGPFGQPGDSPVAGDWSNDGKAKVGVFKNGTWYLDYNGNGRWDGSGIDRYYAGSFGQSGDLPVAGDWSRDGKAKIGVFRAGAWYLDYNGNGFWDGGDSYYPGPFGKPGDLPVAGDWNNDGRAEVGVFKNGTWYLDYNGNGRWDGSDIDRYYPGTFGQFGDLPVAGDWNGDGKAEIGVFRAGSWYLDYNGDGAWNGCNVDRCYEGSFGNRGDLPVAGKW